ncbi:MAG: ATP-binding cassette domain-containing protein, partial [Bacteroidota bacterium]
MADNTVIFSMQGVGKTIPPSKIILKDIYLSFFYGAKIGIIGANGSGKSTLLKIIAGVDENYLGKIEKSKDYSTGLLEQEPKLDESKTVIEIIREGKKEIFALLDEFNTISEAFNDPNLDGDRMEKLLERQGVLQDKIDAANAWEIDQVLNRAMDALQCPEPDALIKNLSGGEKRRVALCRLLLQEPDVLLLDEPTNHLDAESVLWLEHHLAQYKGTVICITHDRYFLDNVAGWILEL